jgi:hypothetical protein
MLSHDHKISVSHWHRLGCGLKLPIFSGVEEPFFYLANEWHKLHGETLVNMAEMA